MTNMKSYYFFFRHFLNKWKPRLPPWLHTKVGVIYKSAEPPLMWPYLIPIEQAWKSDEINFCKIKNKFSEITRHYFKIKYMPILINESNQSQTRTDVSMSRFDESFMVPIFTPLPRCFCQILRVWWLKMDWWEVRIWYLVQKIEFLINID